MTRDDIEFIREYAKCGIHHNWMHKEDKLNEKIDRLNLISSNLYNILNNGDPKDARIASLESQLREKDERIKQYNMLLDPILDWGQSPESGIKLGYSITKEVLRMAKESKDKDVDIESYKLTIDLERQQIEEKDKEIERLKEQVKDQYYDKFHGDVYFGELREALSEALTYIDFNDIDGSVDFSKRCRKLIGE